MNSWKRFIRINAADVVVVARKAVAVLMKIAAVAADVINTPPMAGNVFGKLFRLSSFGESHGAAIGGRLPRGHCFNGGDDSV